LAAAEAQERAAPTDAEAQLLLGLIHGSKALVDGGRRNYFSALQGVREAHRRFQEAQRLDPALVDALYGLGLYQIALDRLPSLVRPFAALVLPSGDAAGAARDRAGRRAGRIPEDDSPRGASSPVRRHRPRYAEAVRLGQELLRRYRGTRNCTCHRPCGVEGGQFEEALEIARRVGSR
jgi:tetratricopeptide (TPR) repeat protein